MQRLIKKIVRRLGEDLPHAKAIARGGLPGAILHFGEAPGDDLLCTCLIHELKRRGTRRVWMVSRHRALFEANSGVTVVSPDPSVDRVARQLGRRVTELKYVGRDWDGDQDTVPTEHILAALCRCGGLSGKVALRPYLTLSQRELRGGRFAPRQVAIMSSGMSARFPMKNKEWFAERFQEVVESTSPAVKFVQVGSAADPLLRGVVDVRGKMTIRETGAVLANSDCFVGQVGFLMHLARAVETPAVIVYGGREAPWQTGYVANENLYSPVPCAPCWRWNTCDHDRRCMREIQSADVYQALQRVLARETGGPLPVETVDLLRPRTDAPQETPIRSVVVA